MRYNNENNMPNFNFFDFIQQFVDSHAAAGAAGGAIRAISKRETLTRILLFAVVGAVAASYLAPVLTWTAIEYLAPKNPDQALGGVGKAMGFATGLAGMQMSGLLEKVFEKWLKK